MNILRTQVEGVGAPQAHENLAIFTRHSLPTKNRLVRETVNKGHTGDFVLEEVVLTLELGKMYYSGTSE